MSHSEEKMREGEGQAAAYRRKLDPLLAEYAYACRQEREEESALEAAEATLRYSGSAQGFVQEVAAAVQTNVHAQVAGVVTRCLRAVFGAEGYDFEILFEQKRGRTEARFRMSQGGLVLEDDLPNEVAHGVLDVAGFALRMVCLLLSRPPKRRLLLLDEPLKNVHSPLYRERVRVMLETLAEEMGVQIILTTGVREYECGKVIDLEAL